MPLTLYEKRHDYCWRSINVFQSPTEDIFNRNVIVGTTLWNSLDVTKGEHQRAPSDFDNLCRHLK